MLRGGEEALKGDLGFFLQLLRGVVPFRAGEEAVAIQE
jgi:hypothetical protein